MTDMPTVCAMCRTELEVTIDPERGSREVMPCPKCLFQLRQEVDERGNKAMRKKKQELQQTPSVEFAELITFCRANAATRDFTAWAIRNYHVAIKMENELIDRGLLKIDDAVNSSPTDIGEALMKGGK